MTFKFMLEQVVFYLKDNRVHSAEILARHRVENLRDEYACGTKEQADMWAPWGATGTYYMTCHGRFKEDKIFGTKEELAAALVAE